MCGKGGEHELPPNLKWVINTPLKVGLGQSSELKKAAACARNTVLYINVLKQHVVKFYCFLVVFYILFSPGFVDSTREARGIAYLTTSQSLVFKSILA